MPPQKRFSLKTLLSLVTIACIWVGYLAAAYRFDYDDVVEDWVLQLSAFQILLRSVVVFGVPYAFCSLLVYRLIAQRVSMKGFGGTLLATWAVLFVFSIYGAAVLGNMLQTH